MNGNTTSQQFDSLPPPPRGGPERNGISVVSIADFGPAEEPDWVWPGYLARGSITLLTGLWKAGKTTLVKHLLRDLACGGGLVDDPLGGSVLMLSEENSGEWARRREALGLPDSILFLQRENFTRPGRPEWEAIIARMRFEVEHRGVGLVVIDTLPSAWPVMNENDASEVGGALAPLRAISEAGAAVLLVHHPRKGDGSQGTASRGSGALPGFVDVILELRRYAPEDSGDTRRTLTAMGRFDGIPPETVIDLGPEGFTVVGDRVAVRLSDLTETILGLLPETGPGLTIEDLLESWPDPTRPGKPRLSRSLADGSDAGRWTETGKGVKGDPRRFYGPKTGSDSIPFTPPPRGGPESNGIVDPEPTLIERGTEYL